MLMIYIIGFIVSLTLVLLTPLVKKFAVKIGAVDVPNARKVHTGSCPDSGTRHLSGFYSWTDCSSSFSSDSLSPRDANFEGISDRRFHDRFDRSLG